MNFCSQPVKIAIIGRPNVGKSSFFNRLIKKRKAIVAPQPGVTVDRLEEEIDIYGKKAVLIDTGGIIEGDKGLSNLIKEQVIKAVEESDILLFMVDAREGLHPLDKYIASIIRGTNKPTFLLINKVDNEKIEHGIYEFAELGNFPAFSISVAQGKGISKLLEEIHKIMPETTYSEDKLDTCKIAFVGRPNVGKSSLINRIIGEKRVVVSEIPGTTKDSIDIRFRWKNQEFILIDTAGLRRKSRVSTKLEAYSITRTINSIRNSDISVLIIDAIEGPTDQDQKIAGVIQKEKKGVIIAINKMDIFKGDVNKLIKSIEEHFYFLNFAPRLFISAKTGKGIKNLLNELETVRKQMSTRVKTSIVNRAIQETVNKHHPPSVRGKYIKIYYGTQIDTFPPKIVVFSNYPEYIPDHYKRYFEKSLREKLKFHKSPLDIIWRKRE